MSSSAYWNSQYQYYMNNQPPKAESYYNQSFVDKINEAQKNIDNLVSERDKSWSATGQKQDEYNAFYGNMSSYGDVYSNAENEFGVKEAQGTYEESKKALALAESTLDALPSSINASSNRVLTQAQREARYNALSDKYMSYRDNLLARSSAYEDVWKKARANQAAYAQAEMASQWGKLGDYNNAFNIAIDQYMNAEKKLTEGKIEKSNWESQYRSWQHQQYQNAQQVWLNNMNAALTRYIQALNTEMVVRQSQLAMERAAKNDVKTWDFGGGYTLQGVSGKNAMYYYNGKSISAGRFLEETGANGAQWNKWNDVWNSGVKTNGVGSDTIEAFNRRSSADSKYAYLFR